MSARMRNQRLVALFAAGWALLNFPLLTLWIGPLTLAGIPPAAAGAGVAR